MTTPSSHHPIGTGTSVGQGLELRVPAASTPASISVHEGTLAPGDAIPAHRHDGADQLLYIVEGRWRSRSAMPCSLPVVATSCRNLAGSSMDSPTEVLCLRGFLRSPQTTASSVSPSLRLNSPTRRRFRPSRPHTAYTQAQESGSYPHHLSPQIAGLRAHQCADAAAV